MVWCRAFNEGELSDILQVDDGFIAVGHTKSTLDKNNNAIEYNPVSGTGTIEDCDDQGNGWRDKQRMNVVKILNDGTQDWTFNYGDLESTNSDWKNCKSQGFSLVETSNGDFIIAGVDYLTDDTNDQGNYSGYTYTQNDNDRRFFALKIDDSGNKLLDQKYGSTSLLSYLFSVRSNGESGSNERFVMAGVEFQNGAGEGQANLFIIEDDLSVDQHKELTTTSANDASTSYDAIYDQDGNIIWAVHQDCDQCFAGQINNAKGEVHRLDVSNNLNILWTSSYGVSSGKLSGFDLKTGLTLTQDGNIALVSTVRSSKWSNYWWPGLDPLDGSLYPYYESELEGFCSIDFSAEYDYWQTNAYVAKYNLSGDKLWDTNWDSDPEQALPYPKDWKEQECVYNITEADDGGLVITGNTSHNFDDYYIVKLRGDCELNVVYDGEDDLHPSSGGQVEFLNTSTTWTNSRKIAKRIVVQNNTVLTLSQGVFEFADSKSVGYPVNITVEKGGQLIIEDGAVLKSIDACSKSMWDGIIVLGDPQVAQSNLTNSQGKVVVSGASIEDARTAIHAGDVEYDELMSVKGRWGKGGAIVQISNAEFNNCRHGIHFGAYPWSQINGNSDNTLSFIRNSTFKGSAVKAPRFDSPEGYRRGLRSAISMINIDGLKITGTYFYNEAVTEARQRGTGIVAYSSKYQITCEEKDANCECINNSENIFDNFEKGIDHYNTHVTLGNLNVFGARFERNLYGVQLSETNGANIVNNDFDITHQFVSTPGGVSYPDPEWAYATMGISVQNGTGYEIQENSISSTDLEYSTGIHANNLTSSLNSELNFIRRNTLEDFEIASSGSNYNRGINPSNGLKLTCNDIQSNKYDILSIQGLGISEHQKGIFGDGANNTFDNCVTPTSTLFNAANAYDYYYDGLTSDPTFVGSGCKTSLVTINQFTNNSNAGCELTIYDDGCDGRRSMSGLKIIHDSLVDILGFQDSTYFQYINSQLIYAIYESDTSSVKFDRIDSLLDLRTDSWAQLLKVESHFTQEEDEAALDLLDSLKADSVFGEYATLRDTLYHLESAEVSSDSVKGNQSLIDFLFEKMEDSTHFESGYARNILCMYGVIDRPFHVMYYPTSSSKTSDIAEVDNESIFKNAYPNPFNNELNFEIKNCKSIAIYNNHGQRVYNQSRLKSINTSNWAPGLYVYYATLNSGQVIQGKCIKY